MFSRFKKQLSFLCSYFPTFYDFLSNSEIIHLSYKYEQKCRGCSKGIDMGSFFIQSMIKFNNESVGGDDSKEITMETLKNSCFHPKCFKCVRCNQDLVDLAHCLLKNKLYCVRHFGEQFRPRCDHCEEVGYFH